MSDLKMERLLEFNAGGIVGLATCPWAHFAVTAGTDGSVRLYDYRKKEAQMYSKRFYQPASCMMMLPEHVDDSQRVVLVGFADGMVRVLLRGKSDWKLMGVMKPHKKAVTSIAVSPDGKMLASASKDGSIFFFTVQDPVTYMPLAFTVIQVCRIPALCIGRASATCTCAVVSAVCSLATLCVWFTGTSQQHQLLGGLQQPAARLREWRGDGDGGARR